MHYRRRQKYVPRMTNMRISSKHTSRQHKYTTMKLRTKSRVPWETLAVREKRADEKTASKCNRKNPMNTNAQKLKKAQNE